MGYNTRPEMVEANAAILRQIKERLGVGQELHLRIAAEQNISTEQYRLRRVLAATDRHPEVMGGEFCRLGSLTTVSIDMASRSVVVKPRGGAIALNFEVARFSEADALRTAATYSGSMLVLEFHPSGTFDLDGFTSDLAELGFRLVPETMTQDVGGQISYAAERLESKSALPEGFEALEEYKSPPAEAQEGSSQEG